MSVIKDIALSEPLVDSVDHKAVMCDSVPVLELDIRTCCKEVNDDGGGGTKRLLFIVSEPLFMKHAGLRRISSVSHFARLLQTSLPHRPRPTPLSQDLAFHSDFSLEVSRSDYCHAFVAYFECSFTQVIGRAVADRVAARRGALPL